MKIFIQFIDETPFLSREFFDKYYIFASYMLILSHRNSGNIKRKNYICVGMKCFKLTLTRQVCTKFQLFHTASIGRLMLFLHLIYLKTEK